MITIKVWTLFDITKTNVRTRRHDFGPVEPYQIKLRNQQSNFETLLQVIGMRAQPEYITDPEKTMEPLPQEGRWGLKYYSKSKIPVWSFEFTVSHREVFTTSQGNVGGLLEDCVGIPMFIGLDENHQLKSLLDVTPLYKNIHFEVII